MKTYHENEAAETGDYPTPAFRQGYDLAKGVADKVRDGGLPPDIDREEFLAGVVLAVTRLLDHEARWHQYLADHADTLDRYVSALKDMEEIGVECVGYASYPSFKPGDAEYLPNLPYPPRSGDDPFGPLPF